MSRILLVHGTSAATTVSETPRKALLDGSFNLSAFSYQVHEVG